MQKRWRHYPIWRYILYWDHCLVWSKFGQWTKEIKNSYSHITRQELCGMQGIFLMRQETAQVGWRIFSWMGKGGDDGRFPSAGWWRCDSRVSLSSGKGERRGALRIFQCGGGNGFSTFLTCMPLRLLMRDCWPTAFFVCLNVCMKSKDPIFWILTRFFSLSKIAGARGKKIENLQVIEKNLIRNQTPLSLKRPALLVCLGMRNPHCSVYLIK